MLVPCLALIGLAGAAANLALLADKTFSGSAFFFLRALSLCDLVYLLCVFGYILEMFIFESMQVFWI